ncbi:MAG: DUF503 domain-containing protein [Eubacteriales bacterium]|nr:DUF503 domain-containing protein [Eubacteriales bacterium]
MTVLSAEINFYIPHARSLKEKRMISRSLTDRVRHKFNVSVAETDNQDLCQTLTIGVAVVSGSAVHARSMLDNIIGYMEESTDAEITGVIRNEH